MLKKTLVVAATTLALAGATATGASAAYDLTGGDYSGSNASGLEFSMGGTTRAFCDGWTASGNTENVTGDAASTTFTPSFSDCAENGSQALVAQVPQAWKLTVTGSRALTGHYDAVISTPDRTLVEFVDPIAVYFPELAPYVCKYTWKTPVGGSPVRVRQLTGALQLVADTENLSYESNLYCSTLGADNGFLSNAEIDLSGVGIDEL